MPTYQYRCTECGNDSEAFQKFTDDPLTECTVCGGKLRKVFSPVGVVFKGSGFYKTDSTKSAQASHNSSASHSESKTEKAASSPNAATGTKTESSTKSKPESNPQPTSSPTSSQT